MTDKLKVNGFDIETDSADDRVFINIDKDGKNGGYIQVKFEDEGIVIDVFNASGDCINTMWNEYNEVEPMENENDELN